MRHLDWSRVRGRAVERGDELARGLGEIAADLENGNELPILGKRRVESAQRVGDAAPFLYRRVSWVSPVDHVPDEAAHDAGPPFARHQIPGPVVKSEPTKGLHFERGDSADDSGGEGKGPGNDAARFGGVLEPRRPHCV